MNNMASIIPVILCGGAGSRLWPMSRASKPKQFHALFNDKTLLQNTIERMPEGQHDGLNFKAPCILGSASLLGELEKSFWGRPAPGKLILEPAMRDTAAAIAACVVHYAQASSDEIMVVVPSDARIDDHVTYRETVAQAAKVCSEHDAIMLIGIKPTRAETQYGYIERGHTLGGGYEVRRFREKPDTKTAAQYLASGNFLWNAGMFVFRVGRMADAFQQFAPQIWEKAQLAVGQGQTDGNNLFLEHEAFSASPATSIDYAIMEKADNIGVIEAQFDWDDLGSWNQLYAGADKDENANAVSGAAVFVDASANYVRSDGPTIAIAGINCLTVIAEDNKVLVVPTAQSHLVKPVTQAYRAMNSGKIAFDRSKASVRNWLFEVCLPFWAQNGIDAVHGGVHEALTFEGKPAPHNKKRLRVLPRQLYCFAHAAHLGWEGMSEPQMRKLFDHLVETGWHAEGGFIHLYHPDGTIKNDMRDAYDQCFALLAFAWLHRAFGWPEARQWADKTLAWMDEALADSTFGGYSENTIGTQPRRANPHMHFLEAMLGWYDATGETIFLDRAQEIVKLFDAHFLDAQTGTIIEYFQPDWSPVTDGSALMDVEPGHHYEWAWLLLRYLEHRDHPGLEAKARTVFSTARAMGHHAQTGAAADTMTPDGSRVSSSARCWPQTEALKAAISFQRRGMDSAGAMRKQMLDVLFDQYLAQPLPGGWVDARDDQGRNIAADMPSSTFYHVFCALVEHLESKD